MKNREESYEVNLFSPKKGYMVGEVAIILAILFAWGWVTFGFQFLVYFFSDHNGVTLFSRYTFFNLPFHFWFTGQFLPLWFIILCVIFNVYIDRLTQHHSRRRDRTYD